jgi:hypothetical protein
MSIVCCYEHTRSHLTRRRIDIILGFEEFDIKFRNLYGFAVFLEKAI